MQKGNKAMRASKTGTAEGAYISLAKSFSIGLIYRNVGAPA